MTTSILPDQTWELETVHSDTQHRVRPIFSPPIATYPQYRSMSGSDRDSVLEYQLRVAGKWGCGSLKDTCLREIRARVHKYSALVRGLLPEAFHIRACR